MRKLLMLVSVVVGLAAMSLIPPKVQAQPETPIVASEAATMAVLVPLVAKWEGKRNAAYFDVVGVPTICFGHTRTVTAADVGAGTSKTDAECSALLRSELREYRDGVRGYFNAEALRSWLPPNRDAAFASTAYNVGISGIGKSTATRRLNAGNLAGACEALTWWNRAGGRVLRGLVNRRADEFALCMVGL
jgi:lysozyme